MSIEAVEVSKSGKVRLCRITDLSDEFKEYIKDELANISFGQAEVNTLPKYYDLKNTLTTFFDRYDTKSPEIQIGMIGELISHLLIPKIDNELTSLSIFLNKEERSIKKGFDIVYGDLDKKILWYSEVKSGEKSAGFTSDDANIKLINRSYNDIKEKLTGTRVSLWQAAIFDLAHVFEEANALTAKKLLSEDSPILRRPNLNDKQVILVSVLFEDVGYPVNIEVICSHLALLVDKNEFRDIIIFSFQKSTLEKIVSFLREEYAN